MRTKTQAVVRLKFSSEKQLDAVLAALKPEAESPINRRYKISLIKQNLFLVLNVNAEDTVALRAALNSYLRWIDSMVNVICLTEKL